MKAHKGFQPNHDSLSPVFDKQFYASIETLKKLPMKIWQHMHAKRIHDIEGQISSLELQKESLEEVLRWLKHATTDEFRERLVAWREEQRKQARLKFNTKQWPSYYSPTPEKLLEKKERHKSP